MTEPIAEPAIHCRDCGRELRDGDEAIVQRYRAIIVRGGQVKHCNTTVILCVTCGDGETE